MGVMKSIIDSNEAAAAYTKYMRQARRDGDKLPTRRHRDPEKRALARELNRELDKVQVGYQAQPTNVEPNRCERCHGPIGPGSRLVGSIYPDRGPRIDRWRCEHC
jgi:membrane peptidoglycan carboxypeptidase